jgi:hypothetical protein
VLAYLIPDASPLRWPEHPAGKRLAAGGIWQAQPHEVGTLVAWKQPDARPARIADFLPGRQTADGLTYYGPKVLPAPEALRIPQARPRIASPIEIRPGVVVMVRPALASPRKLLCGGGVGDYSEDYPIRARALMGRLKDGDRSPEAERELLAIVVLALRLEYYLTDELLDDLGWIDEESIFALWEGVLGVGKQSGDGGAAC